MSKKLSRLRAVACALLALAMCVGLLPDTARAAGTGQEKHSIIIEKVNKDATYQVYKLLDLVVGTKDNAANATGKAVKTYQYSFSEDMRPIVTDVAGRPAFAYSEDSGIGFDINHDMLVFQASDEETRTEDEQAAIDAMMVSFADALRVEIEKKGADLTPVRTVYGRDANQYGQLVIGELDHGYYMVTSNAGARSVVFTNPSEKNGNMVIREKNDKPTIGKTASTDNAGIGDQVEFDITVNATAGSENLKVIDTMSGGLRLDDGMTVVFKPVRAGAEDVALAKAESFSGSEAAYTFESKAAADGGTEFALVINPAFLKTETFMGEASTLEDDGGQFVITYKATVTGDALEMDKVTNSAGLKYGHGSDYDLETGTGDGDITPEIPLDPDKTYTVKWVDENGDPIPEIPDKTINPGDPMPDNPDHPGDKPGRWSDPIGPDDDGVIIVKWIPYYTVRWVDENGNKFAAIDDRTIGKDDPLPANPNHPDGQLGGWKAPVRDDGNYLITIQWNPYAPVLEDGKTYTVRWVDEDGVKFPTIDDVVIKSGDALPTNPGHPAGNPGAWAAPEGPDANGLIIVKWVPGDPEDDTSVTEVEIKIYDMTVFKFAAGDAHAPLADARFQVFRDPAGTDTARLSGWIADAANAPAYEDGKVTGLVRLVDLGVDEGGNRVYRPAVVYEADGTTETEEFKNAADTVVTPDITGTVVIKGLGNGQYALDETEAPAGYIELDAPEYKAISDMSIRFDIANASGIRMPDTGGIGTTVFYLAGAALVAAAGVLLFLKKRSGHGEA